MSNNNDSNDSNDNELNILIAATGLTGNSRYVKDMEALADKAEKAIRTIAGINGRKVDNVVIRENYDLEQLLEERLDADALPDVQYYGIDWRQLLDDSDETNADGDVIAKGVMQDDEKPVGVLMAEDGGVDADEFDLNDRDDRDSINYDLIDQKRINRAKARARGKTDERLYNDYFDSVPTVSAAVFLNDGTNRSMQALEAARGINPFVKYPTACSGTVLDISCNKDEDSILDWARYLLETDKLQVEDLTDAQEEELRAIHSDDDLEYMGLSVEDDSETVEEAPTPEPATAEDSSRMNVTNEEAQAVAGGEPAKAD